MNRISLALLLQLLFSVGWTHTVVQAAEVRAVPDFTKNGKIWDSHDWNLGPTGARGWIYTAEGNSSRARQILVTSVAKGSPADGILNSGDVILGTSGQPFSRDARIEFANAITSSERELGRGELKLLRWRNGQAENVMLKLAVLGDYSDTAPYDCRKSKRIFEMGCQTLAKKKLESVNIENCMNALALLASGRAEYQPQLAEFARHVADFKSRGMVSWYYGYATIFLAEYVLATGDKSVMPGLSRLAGETARGASTVGTWGHDFANPRGNCKGYGCMNLPGLSLLLGMVIAREAGVQDPDVDRVIAKASSFLRWYVNKGAIPYGDHTPWYGHEDNGKCSIAAVVFDLLNDREAAQFFSKMATAAYDERERGHTGNYFNVLWALAGVSRSGTLATGAYWKEQGWYYDLAREWDGRFGYQGSPEGEEESNSYKSWDCTGSYMLTYALSLKSLYVTGKKACSAPALTRNEVDEVIASGRDYFTARNNKGYQGRSNDQLLAGLSNWSPIVRKRSGQGLALSKSQQDLVPKLIQLLESSSLNTRYGACEALEALRGTSAPAVPALRKMLKDEDPWLRMKAATALAAMGAPGRIAIPDLLSLLATPNPGKDPRGMEQRYLCQIIFDRPGMLKNSLDGVDRQELIAAVRVGLRNEDGHARSAASSIFKSLTFDEIKPLLPAIHKAVLDPAPSGEMFADGVRINGLNILAKHGIEEGIDACVFYTRDQNPWASQKRTPMIMQILATYGACAKRTVSDLEQIAVQFDKGEKDFPREMSRQKAAAVRDAIKAIELSTENPKLIRIADLDSKN